MADERIRYQVSTEYNGAGFAALNSSMSNAKKALTGLTVAAGAFMGAWAAFQSGRRALSFFTDSVDMLAREQALIAQLSLALKNHGIVNQAVVKDLSAFAQAMQEKTDFEKEDFLAMEKLFASFGMGAEEIKKTTVVASDFAVAIARAEGGTANLNTAALLLTKAFQGETSTLTRYGIKIEEGLPPAERYAAVMKQMAQFTGQSSAALKEYSGEQNQVHKNFDDLRKMIGELLMPTMRALYQESNSVIKSMQSYVGSLKTVFSWLAEKLFDPQKRFEEMERAFINAKGGRVYWQGLMYENKRFLEMINETRKALKGLPGVQAQASVPSGNTSQPDFVAGAAFGPGMDVTEKAWNKLFAIQGAIQKFDAEMSSEHGRAWAQYFDVVTIASERAGIEMATDAQDAANRQQAAIQRIKNLYEEEAKTIVGGFRQAFIEIDIAATNWRNNFNGLFNSISSNFSTGLLEAAKEAEGFFNTVLEIVNSFFESVKKAFFDLLAQMAARAATYEFFSLLSGGSFGGGGLLKFLGFAEGGLVPGSAGAARLAVVHGGEYVLPASVVRAITEGRSTPSGALSGAGLGPGGGPAVINQTLNISVNGGASSPTEARKLAAEIAEAARRGTTWAVEHSKITYKVGQSRSGETSL